MTTIDRHKLRELILAEDITAVCVDTNIYEAQQFAFHRGVIGEMRGLAGAGLSLLVPDVVGREIMDHLSEKLPEALVSMRKAMRVAANFGLISEDVITQAQVGDMEHKTFSAGRLNNFIDQMGATRIFTAELVELSDVIDSYFDLRAPFDLKKKSEFPDAFVLNALEKWARRKATHVVLISDDHGWKRFADASEVLHAGPTLSDLLVAIQDPDVVMLRAAVALIRGICRNQIRRQLEERISGANIQADAESYHYVEVEITEVNVLALAVDQLVADDLEIVRNEGGEFVVRWEFESRVRFSASVELSSYDSIDRDYVVLGVESVRRIRNLTLEVLLSFSSIKSDMGIELNFNDIELITRRIDVDLGEVELGGGEPAEE